MKNPCINCRRKQEDDYGLLCDLWCGEHSAWLNYQAGIKEVLPYAEKFLAMAEYGDATDGELYDSYKEQWKFKLKEWGIE